MDFDFSDKKNVRLFLIAIGLVILVTIVVALIFSIGSSGDDEQDITRLTIEGTPTEQDIRTNTKEVTPIVIGEIILTYIEEEDYYTISYPGYMSYGKAKFETLKFFQEKTDSENVKLKFENASKEIEEYDWGEPSEEDMTPPTEGLEDGQDL